MKLCSEKIQKELAVVTADFVKSIKATTLKELIEEKNFSDRKLYEAAVRLAYLDASRTFSGLQNKYQGSEIVFNKTIKLFIEYFSSENNSSNFEKIHQKLCKGVQEDFNGIGYTATYGQAQKIVNMTFKYLYCAPKRNGQYEEHFKHCHMPLDSYIFAWFRRTVLDVYNDEEKKAGRAIIKKEEFDKVKWSKLEDCGKKNDRFTYLWFQDKIAAYLKSEKSKYRNEKGAPLSPFLAEFLIWPEEQIRQIRRDLQKDIENLNKIVFFLSEKDKQSINNTIKQLNVNK